MFATHSDDKIFRRFATLFAVLAAGLLMVACQGNGDSKTSTAEQPVEGAERNFTLHAYLSGYKGVGGEIDGEVNPDLNVNAGDKVTITIINKEDMAHDIALDSDDDKKTETLTKKGERATLTFTARADDTYYCSVPGHRQAGMVGDIVVGSGDDSPKAQASSDDGHSGGPTIGSGNVDLDDAKKVSVDEIGRSATDVPEPIDRDEPKTVEFVIESQEVVAEMDDGTTYEMWTYDGTVPGPMLRARVGDTVVVHLDNSPDSTMSHSIDFHAVTGPGGGAAVLQAPPGERRSLKFKALQPGLYVYHCATPHIPTHLARGMYGMILIEPEDGLEPVDKEFYVMQGEYYTKARPGAKGHQAEDADKMFWEMPTYVVFNGRVGSLTEDRALKAKVGETVRIFFGVGGPNTRSSFHIIGEIFDKVYPEAAITDPPSHSVQTTLVPPGGATMVEMGLEYPGKYLLVDHALTRLDKGALGILDVAGEENPEIYEKVE